jgi:hypothetical protein
VRPCPSPSSSDASLSPAALMLSTADASGEGVGRTSAFARCAFISRSSGSAVEWRMKGACWEGWRVLLSISEDERVCVRVDGGAVERPLASSNNSKRCDILSV